ncbi:hypothetical protein DPMN_092793 [Dreissena polymorpha]|uniref:Uncharacterized protein n=1 Tax=Dreissena polymorpha TaxID=45954 RepID=A0A9D4R1B4_DREPO|nr:hypothetical protein DPMN_092793 [Dreissena polymorpha]
MIPERNLMHTCGIEDVLQRKWVSDITDMLEEGPGVILRLPKIRKAIVASPEPMLWLSKKKMEIEMLQLEEFVRSAHCLHDNREADSDFMLNAIRKRIKDVYGEVQLRIFQEGSFVNDFKEFIRELQM